MLGKTLKPSSVAGGGRISSTLISVDFVSELPKILITLQVIVQIPGSSGANHSTLDLSVSPEKYPADADHSYLRSSPS